MKIMEIACSLRALIRSERHMVETTRSSYSIEPISSPDATNDSCSPLAVIAAEPNKIVWTLKVANTGRWSEAVRAKPLLVILTCSNAVLGFTQMRSRQTREKRRKASPRRCLPHMAIRL